MSSKKPIRAVFNDSNVATGLAEYQSGEFIPLTHGGLGASLSIGSAGQVLKVNSGGSALEFGAVEAIVNIDNASDLESATLAVGDKILLSDGGTEGRVLLSQLDTLFSGTSKTLTNKTINASNNTISNITNSMLSGSAGITNANLANSAITIGTTSISLGASNTTIAGISNLTAGGINITGNSITSADSSVIEMGEGLSITGNLTVSGNMTVSGTTTTLETTNSVISDKLIELANGTSGTPSGDIGIVGERGSSDNTFIGFDESADEFIVGTGSFTGATSGDLSFTHGTFSSAGNKIYKAGTAHAVSLVASSSLAGNVTLTLPVNDGDANQLLSTDGSGNLSFISATSAAGAGLSDLSDDTSPSLGGNLDMNGNDIVTLSNANIDLLPHGTGKVIMDGDGSSGGVSVSDGLIDIRTGTGNVSKVKFYCESSNAHAQTLQAAPHSAGSSAVLTLPTATGTLVGTGDTGSVSNTMLAGSIAASKLAGSIGDSLLSTITTAGKVELGALEIDGATDIGADLVDADLLIVDDGAAGTERKSTFTRVKKYIYSAMSGDATSSDAGVLTIASDAVEQSMIADDAVGADQLAASAVVNASVASGAAIDATKIHDGSISNTEFGHLNNVSSNIQTQLDNKAAKSFAIAQAVALG